MDWIDRYGRTIRDYRAGFEEILAASLAELNEKLREAGVTETGGG
jgi:hypothetical protein